MDAMLFLSVYNQWSFEVFIIIGITFYIKVVVLMHLFILLYFDISFIMIPHPMLGTEFASNDTLARHGGDGGEMSCGWNNPEDALNFTHTTMCRGRMKAP